MKFPNSPANPYWWGAPKKHYNYNYNAETGNLAKLKADGAYFSGEIIPTYDKFGRTENKTIDFSVNGSKAFYNKLIFDYVTNAYSESVLVSQLISQVGKTSSNTTSTTYNYTYDDNGNITQITNASGVIQNKYYYDALGQLTREDNRALNSTYTYSYDNAGNITSKKRYAFTTGTLGSVLNTFSYTYGDSTWKDLLTNYNGTSISYDTIGNPTSIGNAELTWQGRTLTEYYNGDYEYLNFGYNADGIRTSKEYSCPETGAYGKHTYVLNGSQILSETYTYEDYDGNVENWTIVYIYDETGSPIGMKYREPSYAEGVYDVFFFEKNLQGDIIAVYNSNGTKLLTYDYDAWGNCTESDASQFSARGANYNPFRYRGYYYDRETGWYYLQSRYYNPEWGRFLNADEYLSTAQGLLSYNTYTYCLNNSIMSCDSTGKWTFSIGWSFSAFLFGGVTYSVSLSFDSSGNIALQTSKADIFQESSGGTFGFASAGLSKSYSFTTLETVDDLNGPALNAGVSGSVYGPFSAGGEIISSPSNPTNIVGGSLSVGGGVGTPIEAHSTVSITETKGKINIFEIAKNAWTKFINWVGGQ